MRGRGPYDAAGNLSSYTPTASMATLSGNFASASVPTQVTLSNRPPPRCLCLGCPSPLAGSFVVSSSYQVQVSTLANFANFVSQPWAGLFYPHPCIAARSNGLLTGTAYYVRVRASDSFGNTSAYSATASMANVGPNASKYSGGAEF